MVAHKLQVFLEDTNSLDPFHLGFQPCHGTSAVLVALLDDLLWEADWRSVTLLVFPDFLATFDTVNYSSLLDQLLGLRTGGTMLL